MSTEKFQSSDLAATGWFSELTGPWGRVPVQFTATLAEGGEFIYFRARGSKVTLEVYPSQEDEENERNLIALYSMDYPRKTELADGEVDFGAGVMEVSEAEALIQEWVGTYLRHRRQAAEVSALADSLSFA